jgi:uncharacterized membrane protein YeaQ/YmgE (transglycosylase-associated protein family)
MTLRAITVVLVGLTAGYLADLVIARRGHGMTGDALLGIGGGLAGGALFNVLATPLSRAWLPLVVAASAGAVAFIAAQRLFWQARP